MNAHSKQTRVDWAFGGLIFALCALLTVLQFRWTGQVADAELSRQRNSLNDRVGETARAFDTELNHDLSQLSPPKDSGDAEDFEADSLARFKSWKQSHPRPIFSRIAVAEPDSGDIRLSLIDQADGRLVRTNWPAGWSELKDNLTDKLTSGGSPPYDDARGLLLEFPAFAAGRNPENLRWLVVELDSNYLHDVWLPGLVSRYLGSTNHLEEQVVVRTARNPPVVFYASPTNWTKTGASVVSVPFNFLGRSKLTAGGPPISGGHWLLEAWRSPGALESLVLFVRLRNLAVAVALNLMMLATGFALIRYTRRSRQLAEQQMRFVANVSHEFRTPLTVIRGAAHNLQRGLLHEKAQIEKYSDLILTHCEQLTEMIEEVLAFAGAQRGGAAVVRRPVELTDVLNEAVATTAHEVSAANCVVHMDLPPALPAVTGDAAALRRVFQNLITNAAKHAGAGGWIGVTAVVDNDAGKVPMVEIEIADRGPGIPEEELSEIFKPFFRGVNATQSRGSGLGLSLVREIVEAHKGSVSVRNCNGSGTIFTVRLPAASEKAK